LSSSPWTKAVEAGDEVEGRLGLVEEDGVERGKAAEQAFAEAAEQGAARPVGEGGGALDQFVELAHVVGAAGPVVGATVEQAVGHLRPQLAVDEIEELGEQDAFHVGSGRGRNLPSSRRDLRRHIVTGGGVIPDPR
jgi:hypothetical protein